MQWVMHCLSICYEFEGEPFHLNIKAYSSMCIVFDFLQKHTKMGSLCLWSMKENKPADFYEMCLW